MADDQWMKILIGGAILFYLFGQGGGTQGTGGTTDTTTTTVTPGCNYAPTVALNAQDKYAGGQTNWGTWRYKLNSGATATDADGSFEVNKGSSLTVLTADANSSAFYRNVWEPTVECGLNSLSDNNVVAFTTYELKAYNDEGDPMNATTYAANLTIGTGGSRTVKLELTKVADKGAPHGAIAIAEFNQSTYDEGKMALQWDGEVLASISTPNAYTVGIAGSTTKSWKLPAFEDVGTIIGYLDLQADNNIDPGAYAPATVAAYGNGVLFRIYPINCFEEEDVNPSEFKCLVEDMDNTFTSPGGTSKAAAAITTLLIPVD